MDTRIKGYKDTRISLYLAPLLDSKSKYELSESSGASQRYGASEQSRLSIRCGVSERFGASESSGVLEGENLKVQVKNLQKS